ncbi:MAG: hypothetical protein AB7T22_03410 [Calditrichaceae bacterium]
MSKDGQKVSKIVENTVANLNKTEVSQKIRINKDREPMTHDVNDQFHASLPFIKLLTAKKCLSLDIDMDKIRFIVINKSGDSIDVRKWGVQTFPSDDADRFRAMQEALKFIKSHFYKSGMDVHASIFSPEQNIRQVILPKFKKKSDLDNAIFYKNKTELQNFDENSSWSYDVLQEFKEDGIDKLRIQILVVPASIISDYLSVFEKTGLEVKTLIPRPMALQEAYNRMLAEPARDLLVDVSYDFTQIFYLNSGRLEYVRNMGIGARNLEATIKDAESVEKTSNEKSVRVESAASETQKVGGSLLRNRLIGKINDLENKQNPVLHEFFSEILRFMAFLQGRENKLYIDRIFVTGYGIRKESLIPYLRSRLNMPVYVLAPQFVSKVRKTLEYGEFSSTIGAALQTGKQCNLLPAAYKRRMAFIKYNWLLAATCFVTFFAFVFNTVDHYKKNLEKRQMVESYEKNYSKYNEFETQYKTYEDQITKIKIEKSELAGVVENSAPIVQILQIFSNETPSEIRLQRIEFRYVDLKSKKVNKDDLSHYKYQIDVTGYLKKTDLTDDVVLVNFINHLKGLKFFKDIKISKVDKNREDNFTGFEFIIYF